MPTFSEIGNKLVKIDTNKIAETIFKKPDVIKWILGSITGRLFKTGIAGDGTRLKTDESIGAAVYSSFTIGLKREDGQPTNKVTLKDTGEFYDSFHIFARNTYFEIVAQFEKEEGNIYDNFTFLFQNEDEFIEAITSMTVEEFENLLFKEVYEDVLKEFKKQISA